MTQYYNVDADYPDWQTLRLAATFLQKGALLVYPTDACYALGCLPQSKSAIERIYAFRQLKRSHDFTLLCADLKMANEYANIDNMAFKILKRVTPGPYTFILPAHRQVPSFIKELHLEKKDVKTMGIRIPRHPVLEALLQLVEQPILTTTLQLPGQDIPLNAENLTDHILQTFVDVVIDAGPCAEEGTTVVDLSVNPPVLMRKGVGEWE